MLAQVPHEVLRGLLPLALQHCRNALHPRRLKRDCYSGAWLQELASTSLHPKIVLHLPEFRHLPKPHRYLENIPLLEPGHRFWAASPYIPKLQNLTCDSRAIPPHRRFWAASPYTLKPHSFTGDLRGGPLPQVLSCIRPREDELVLPKSSSSVFSSTTLDYILRNLGVSRLLVAGCVTDQCVEHAIR